MYYLQDGLFTGSIVALLFSVLYLIFYTRDYIDVLLFNDKEHRTFSIVILLYTALALYAPVVVVCSYF